MSCGAVESVLAEQDSGLGDAGFRGERADDQRAPVERLGQLINASKEGQTAMREILQAHLRRIERDGKGLPIKLFLFTRRDVPFLICATVAAGAKAEVGLLVLMMGLYAWPVQGRPRFGLAVAVLIDRGRSGFQGG